MFAKISLSLATLLLTLTAGEIFFRVINYPPIRDRSFLQLSEKWKNPEKMLNPIGYRDRKYDFTKPDNTLRIYSLGDSFTFGLYLDDESKTYPEIIERKLPKLLKKKVEVINASYPGFTIDQMRNRYETDGRKYDPDIITVGINYDEANLKQGSYYDANSNVPETIKKSRWYQATIGNYFRMKAEKEYREYILGIYSNKNPEEWKQFEEKLITFSNVVKKDEKKLILIIFPQIYPADPNRDYDFYPYNDAYAEFGRQYNVGIVDSLQKVLAVSNKSVLIVNASDSHPTYKMHALTAEALIEYLLQHQF